MEPKYETGVDYDFSGNRKQPEIVKDAGVSEFLELLNTAADVHRKKNADYSGNDDPYENFHRAEIIASWFERPIDKVFATLIGIKMARWANLANKAYLTGAKPNNESLKDTGMDQMVYTGMWAVYDEHQANKKAEEQVKSPGPVNPYKSPYEGEAEYNARIANYKNP